MKRRIIAALSAAALALSVGGGISPAAADAQDGVDYVALGDSVASGNGILPYINDDEPECLRSKKSYPMLLAKAAGLSVVTEACSGEGTADVLVQLGEAADELGADTKLVTLTVGVNDVMWQAPPTDPPVPDPPVFGWAQTLIACSDAGVFPAGTCDYALFMSLLSLDPPNPAVPSLSERIAGLIVAIHTEAPGAQIIVTGYPLLFGHFTGTCDAGLLDLPALGVRKQLTYGADNAGKIDTAVMTANALIAGGVALTGGLAQYVDVNAVSGGFVGHGLCDGGDRWISGLFPATAQPYDRGFHPNPPGQRAYAAILAPLVH